MFDCVRVCVYVHVCGSRLFLLCVGASVYLCVFVLCCVCACVCFVSVCVFVSVFVIEVDLYSCLSVSLPLCF